jgi:hypothetical protein
MQQQPILTAAEVINLLISEMPMTDEERHFFYDTVIYHFEGIEGGAIDLNNPQREFSLLEKCANFLRSKGIHVYFETGDICYYVFAVGECGRVYEKLSKQLSYLIQLEDFWGNCKEMLPVEDPPDFLEKNLNFRLQILNRRRDLEIAYKRDKEQLAQACEECWRLAAEIDAYLDSIKDICRYFEALSQPLPEDEAIHYLNDFEIMELLERELFDDDEALKTFKRMTKRGNLALIDIEDANKEMPVLERCIEFLRGKGLYVFFISTPKGGNCRDATLIVGKRGELAEKFDWYDDELKKIHDFIKTRRNFLPPEVVAEQKWIEHYKDKILGAKHDNEHVVYRCHYNAAIKHWCEEVEKILREIDAYLESRRHLQRVQALTTL